MFFCFCDLFIILLSQANVEKKKLLIFNKYFENLTVIFYYVFFPQTNLDKWVAASVFFSSNYS